MSSTPNASGTSDTLSHRAFSPPVRKPPPSPLAISPASLSPHSLTPNTKNAFSSSSPNARNSLESSRSDLTSLRSEVTSLHCGEFPVPPSSLPPIPASPLTPRSLYFSTTPTTPRSRSPQSEFALPMQEPPHPSRQSLSGSPSSLKTFLTGSHSSGSQPKVSSEQDQPPDRTEPQASRSLEDLKLGYERSRLSVPARFSQYAVYKDANKAAGVSRPETPTTAGTLTNREWVSSSGGSSPLQPPRPAYARDVVPARSHSPLRIESSFTIQQDESKLVSNPDRNEYPHSPQSVSVQAPLSPRSILPQPPRSPLPVPPSRRDSALESTRESARYSHIARKAGITDMGMDISEEQLLSTDFITEMLKQPASSSPRSQFLKLPGSPRSPAFSADDPHGLGRHIRGSEMRLAPELHLALASPGLTPMSVSLSERSMALEDILSPRSPDPVSSALPQQEEDSPDTESPSVRTRSPIPSSILAKGGDKIYLDQPSPMPMPVSPNSQSLAVPENITWGHGSPHPLVPSTPMSMDSFTDVASPRKLRSFAQAQAKHLSSVKKKSSSQSIAARLPIGPSPASSPTSTGKSASSRVGSPRVRQHHYPRPGATKPATQTKQSPVTVVLQRAASSAGSSSPSKEHAQSPTAQEKNAVSEQVQHVAQDAGTSNDIPGSSNASPTSTLHDTLTVSPMPESQHASSHKGWQSNNRSSEARSYSAYSYESNNVSSDSVHDDDDFEIVGAVQTVNRVWDATAPVIAKIGNTTRPTVVGTAKAVVVRSVSVDCRAANGTVQDHLPHLDASSPSSGFEPEMAAPASPRHPPSIEAPPSHHTEMQESAKSVYFSEEAQNGKEQTYLPHDEVTGYGPTFWDINRNASLSAQAANKPPKPPPSNITGSIKSVVSYITAKSNASTVASRVSRISHKSALSTASSRWAWFKKKPLPPIPTSSPSSSSPPNVLVNTYIDRDEPQLPIHKAHTGNVSPILEPGQYQRSKISLVGQGGPQGWNDITKEKWSPEHREDDGGVGATVYSSIGRFDMLGADSLKIAKRKPSRRRDDPKSNEASTYDPQGVSNFSDSAPTRLLRPFQPIVSTKSRKWILFIAMGVVMLTIILGATLGLTLGHMHSNNTPSTCSGNKTGVRCDLDATCTCPSSLSGTCAAPLAGALNALVPVTSQLFSTDITSQGVALVIWESQGVPTTPSCAFQANLVDVGSVLNPNVSPNRTEWAQAALLWNLFKSGDTDAVQSMQLAIAKLPFNSLPSKDGIVADPSGQFSVSSLGYIFNFANQTVTMPPLTFKLDGSPSSDQLSRVNSVAQGALDRMYSFASASSTQQQTALSTYWQSVLSLRSSDLPTFLTAFKSAPIMLPFDATSSPGGQAISDLLSSAVNRSLSFPPAIGCYPGLSSSQLHQISTVETAAFGLAPLNTTASSFDSSCFANHAVYGILDVLRTRLPFSDSSSGVAKQAAVLTSDAASRAVLHVGELLSPLPAPTNINLTFFDVDPREFGTVSHLNHIALEWLQAFPTTTLATEAAKFVLSSPSAPPPSSSSLFNATSLPIVEVAMFGNIFLADFSSFSSSFSTPSGSLFFGSSQAQAFRRWALQQSSSATIAWTQSTFSSQAVHEGSTPNNLFEEIWSAAGSLTAGPTNSSIVQEVVNALQSDGFFSL